MPVIVDPGLPDVATRAAAGPPPTAPTAPPADRVVELVDAIRAGAARGYLPMRPWLALGARGLPVLSLTVILSRRPAPDERDVMRLTERGQLSFDATLVVPSTALRAAGVMADPAFARSVSFALEAPDSGRELARAATSGPGARVALTAALDAAQTRAVVEALAGRESRMRLSVEVVLDRAPVTSRVSLQATWAALYDALESSADDAADIDVMVIEHALQRMVAARTIAVKTMPADLSPSDVMSVAIRGFIRNAGMILARVAGPRPGRYRLTERPAPEFMWIHEETLKRPATRELRMVAPLEQVLGGVLDGHDGSAFVRLIAPDGSPSAYAAIPRFCRGELEPHERDPSAAKASLVLVNATMLDAAALTATSRPVVRPQTLASGELRQTWLADGLLDYLEKKPVRSLPVTTDGSEVLYPDRVDGLRRWYVPRLEPVEPDPAGDPESAPFLFSFERIGAAASGDAALAGTVRVVLRPTVPEAVHAALAAMGRMAVQPVGMLDVKVELSVPFIDSVDNARKRTTLMGTVERSGSDVVATFAVSDKWVRLLYGVLSSPGFQGDEQVSVRYSFCYACYRVTNGSTLQTQNGIKQALIPVDWSSKAASSRPLVFNAKAGTLASGATHIRFVPEAAGVGMAGPASSERAGATSARPLSIATVQSLAGARPALAAAAAAARPIDAAVLKPLPMMIRPALVDLRPLLREREYIQHSVGVQGATDLLVPCNRFGMLYRQKLDDAWQAIGCQPAFSLGTAPAKMYEEVGALANAWLRVYRCLQQPGRFLLLPRAYRIARYAPGHERAYLPAAMVYAVLDPVSAENNRYCFVSTIEPDIPPFVMRALGASLAAYAPAASIRLNLPTEVATQTDLPSMPLASALAPPRFTVTGNGVQVVLECPIADALVLRSAVETGGVLGRLAFMFEDGSRLESDIDIALGQIAGPWDAGPVSVERSGGKVRLTNRIDRALDISTLRLYVAATAATDVAVAERLGVAESVEIAIADDDAEVEVIYRPASSGPRTLEECRVYMEDVTTNVIFTCGINYEARGIAGIEVHARLGADGDGQLVRLSDTLPRVGTVEFTAPLSSVVGASASSPAIEYRLVRVMAAGERVERPWASCPGAVVDIQWDLVA